MHVCMVDPHLVSNIPDRLMVDERCSPRLRPGQQAVQAGARVVHALSAWDGLLVPALAHQHQTAPSAPSVSGLQLGNRLHCDVCAAKPLNLLGNMRIAQPVCRYVVAVVVGAQHGNAITRSWPDGLGIMTR